jgi:hypothetical protein
MMTDEERERMIKADIPQFIPAGKANLTEEELKQGEKDLINATKNNLTEEFRQIA